MPKVKVVRVNALSSPPVNLCPTTLLEEAFENVREWRINHGETLTQEDLKWYYKEVEDEKEAATKYFTENPGYKVLIDSVLQGYNDEQLAAAESIVRKNAPEAPEDPGPMPEYGSKEFWAWCRKRKEIRLKKEAAIIAAGGTVKKKK
jgi:hypothetical protein